MQVFPVFQLSAQIAHPPVVGLQLCFSRRFIFRPPFVHILLQRSRRAELADFIQGRGHQLVCILRSTAEIDDEGIPRLRQLAHIDMHTRAVDTAFVFA